MGPADIWGRAGAKALGSSRCGVLGRERGSMWSRRGRMVAQTREVTVVLVSTAGLGAVPGLGEGPDGAVRGDAQAGPRHSA